MQLLDDPRSGEHECETDYSAWTGREGDEGAEVGWGLARGEEEVGRMVSAEEFGLRVSTWVKGGGSQGVIVVRQSLRRCSEAV